MSEVQVIKISTGEEVIGRVSEGNTGMDFIVMEKPLVVAIAPGPDGKLSVTLIPMFASNQDGDAKIYNNAIIARPEKIASEIEAGYLQQTSGIMIP